MDQKILIAMDDSRNAARAVAQVAQLFSADNHVVLFNVMLDTQSLCKMDSPELTPLFKSQQSQFCALEDKKRELVEAAMHCAREDLMAHGFDERNVEVKIQSKHKGIARDILEEASKGYDLLVIGRRGISGIREFFLGSTSQKVFSGATGISVMVAN